MPRRLTLEKMLMQSYLVHICSLDEGRLVYIIILLQYLRLLLLWLDMYMYVHINDDAKLRMYRSLKFEDTKTRVQVLIEKKREQKVNTLFSILRKLFQRDLERASACLALFRILINCNLIYTSHYCFRIALDKMHNMHR